MWLLGSDQRCGVCHEIGFYWLIFAQILHTQLSQPLPRPRQVTSAGTHTSTWYHQKAIWKALSMLRRSNSSYSSTEKLIWRAPRCLWWQPSSWECHLETHMIQFSSLGPYPPRLQMNFMIIHGDRWRWIHSQWIFWWCKSIGQGKLDFGWYMAHQIFKFEQAKEEKLTFSEDHMTAIQPASSTC